MDSVRYVRSRACASDVASGRYLLATELIRSPACDRIGQDKSKQRLTSSDLIRLPDYVFAELWT